MIIDNNKLKHIYIFYATKIVWFCWDLNNVKWVI